MEFFLNLGFDKGKPQAKELYMKTEPIRGDMLVQPCAPNERTNILRFSHVARFCVRVGDGQKVFFELYDPVIVHCTNGYMEVHGYEKGEDAIYMQSWLLRPTMVDQARNHAAHLHSGQPGHPGHREAE